ncbi:hypothetical protein HU200_025383 [Digitaria exilis]|uniref:Uncharacterized protein n=1 Tax=Digitaria exilis TaxID=1010633 RepID=A0A835C941_9POAL|nr:hypothetical protein HU200_025383 [Digitaria exilis]
MTEDDNGTETVDQKLRAPVDMQAFFAEYPLQDRIDDSLVVSLVDDPGSARRGDGGSGDPLCAWVQHRRARAQFLGQHRRAGPCTPSEIHGRRRMLQARAHPSTSSRPPHSGSSPGLELNSPTSFELSSLRELRAPPGMCCVADVLELTLASTPAGVLDLNSPTSFVAGNGGQWPGNHRFLTRWQPELVLEGLESRTTGRKGEETEEAERPSWADARRKLHRARSAVRLLRRLAVALSEAGSSASQSHELLFLLCFPAPPSPSCN